MKDTRRRKELVMDMMRRKGLFTDMMRTGERMKMKRRMARLIKGC
jgi:hypothetical protein